eukprot:UN07036
MAIFIILWCFFPWNLQNILARNARGSAHDKILLKMNPL